AIERQHIGAQFLVEERGVEASAQAVRLLAPGARDFLVAEPPRHGAGGREGAVGIGLHLAERDRALRQRTVGMKDGIVAVLPALVGEAPGGLPEIFDEAVAVAIAVALDPADGRL